MVAIVIDDVGLSRGRAGRAAALPGPLTLALLSYAEDLPALARTARAAGHELLVHIAMEPEGDAVDPGPRPLLSSHSASELRRRLARELGRFTGYVGVNQPHGQPADRRPGGDGGCDGRAPGPRPAVPGQPHDGPPPLPPPLPARPVWPTLERDVFLDNELDPAAIRAALATVEGARARPGLCHRHRPPPRRNARGAGPVAAPGPPPRLPPRAAQLPRRPRAAAGLGLVLRIAVVAWIRWAKARQLDRTDFDFAGAGWEGLAL